MGTRRAKQKKKIETGRRKQMELKQLSKYKVKSKQKIITETHRKGHTQIEAGRRK